MTSTSGPATNGGFDSLFNAAAKNEASLFMLQLPQQGESREYRQEQRFAANWAKEPAGFTIQNASPIFAADASAKVADGT